jgi:hypothetical protein
LVTHTHEHKAVSLLVKMALVMHDGVTANASTLLRVRIREEYACTAISLI